MKPLLSYLFLVALALSAGGCREIGDSTRSISPQEHEEISVIFAKYSSAETDAERIPCLTAESATGYMTAHKAMCQEIYFASKPEDFSRRFKFKPNMDRAMMTSDPLTYFASVEDRDTLGIKDLLGGIPEIPAEVVGISKEGNTAYIVLKHTPPLDSGRTRPSFEVETVMKTPTGWRIDVSSSRVRNLEIATHFSRTHPISR